MDKFVVIFNNDVITISRNMMFLVGNGKKTQFLSKNLKISIWIKLLWQ